MTGLGVGDSELAKIGILNPEVDLTIVGITIRGKNKKT